MKFPSRTTPSLILFAIALCLWVSPGSADPLRIESPELSVTVDSESGDLLSLEDIGSHTQYLAQKSSPVFMMQLTRGDKTSFWRDSRSAKDVRIERIEGDSGKTLTMQYAGLEDGIAAVVTIAAASDSPELRFHIEIENTSQLILEQLVFPLLRLVRPLGADKSDDRAFIPGGDGCVISAEGMELSPHAYRDYPGSASMQFLAYY